MCALLCGDVWFVNRAKTMTVPLLRFNMILAAFMLMGGGCKSTEEKKKSKEAAALHFHLETNADGTHHNFPTTVYRGSPLRIQVQREPVLDEGFMQKAEVVAADEFGNFAIKITF